MNELTDEQLAEAVVGGLTDTHACECGVKHHVKLIRTHSPWKNSVECPCGRRHGANEFYCKCGATTAWGPKAGLRTVKRTSSCWKAREARFVARIAELEALA